MKPAAYVAIQELDRIHSDYTAYAVMRWLKIRPKKEDPAMKILALGIRKFNRGCDYEVKTACHTFLRIVASGVGIINLHQTLSHPA